MNGKTDRSLDEARSKGEKAIVDIIEMSCSQLQTRDSRACK